MKYELCIACDHCDPSDTNARQQVRCEKISSYVDRFNGCDYYENKEQDEYFKKLLTIKANESELISVKDRLPEEGGEYLTFTYAESFQVLCYSPKHKLFNVADFYSKIEAASLAIEVTHWMPLPKPPKVGADNAEN